ncbi:ABC transporter substrate-binding protein [Actinocorallia longicatena]|uniref:ABC transporter substrate-binding protein n=1 Tax=Actinocorallia longicatena TaxID=111803 RepID=A0ABP6Q405_9ACTN
MVRVNRLLCAAVLVAALPLVGCGPLPGQGESEGKPVKLGFSAWPGWFPWQVAQEKGFFKRNGLDVDLRWYDNYTDSLTALTNGDIDANSQTLNDTLSSVTDGARETIVLVNDNSTGNDQIIARPGINKIADLKGKKVAAEEGTVDHYLLMLALRKAGLGPKDVQFQPMATDAAADALNQGKVDAVGVFAPFTTTALQLEGSKAIATSKDFPGAIPDHLVVTGAFLNKRPDDVQSLVKTWFDTVDWIEANRQEANRIMAKRAGVSESEYSSYEAGTTIFSLEQNVQAFRTGTNAVSLPFQARSLSQFLFDNRLAPMKPALNGLFEPRFILALRD